MALRSASHGDAYPNKTPEHFTFPRILRFLYLRTSIPNSFPPGPVPFLYSFNPHVEVLWYPTMAQFDPNVLASAFVTLGVAALALVCRLVARRMTKVSLWFDDYFAIFAFVCPPDFQIEVTFFSLIPLLQLFAASWSAMMITCEKSLPAQLFTSTSNGCRRDHPCRAWKATRRC